MALQLPPGLTPSEVGFLCEMEHVTVIPRQQLDGLDLLGAPTPPLRPPFPAALPLWLALLLKRQKRANIRPPPWLSVAGLTAVLDFETDDRAAGVFSPAPELPAPTSGGGKNGAAAGGGGGGRKEDRDGARDGAYPSAVGDEEPEAKLEFSPPFLPNSATAAAQPDALPYHWLELGHLLLTHAPDDFSDDPEAVRRLLRDVKEVRASKLRKGYRVLDSGAGVKMNGVGGMEVAEVRGFVGGVVDGLRRINRSREEARRERDAEEGRGNGLESGSGRYADGANDDDDDDDDMQL